jgi:cytoplasmic iron level regulating protein YaaA (DUF328/UPF0246 family)
MLIVISSSKILDFKPQNILTHYTQPYFTGHSEEIMDALRKLKPKQIADLLSINPSLAMLNFDRYAKWRLPFTPENAKQAILAFKGEVYHGLKAWNFNDNDFLYAQDHLRIISGLYGLLRPFDLMQPYRLEMGIKLKAAGAANLYQFWGDSITQKLNEALKPMERPVLINLASAEYFKSVNKKLLAAPIITPEFLDFKNGNYQAIVVYLKKARGMLSRFIIKNQLTNPEDIKGFDEEGYLFNPRLSKGDNWVFTRG